MESFLKLKSTSMSIENHFLSVTLKYNICKKNKNSCVCPFSDFLSMNKWFLKITACLCMNNYYFRESLGRNKGSVNPWPPRKDVHTPQSSDILYQSSEGPPSSSSSSSKPILALSELGCYSARGQFTVVFHLSKVDRLLVVHY